MHPSATQQAWPRTGWVVVAVLLVLSWRVAAFLWPASLVPIPEGLRLAMALFGGLFLVCGLVVWWWRPNRWTSIFLVYCLGGGLHWGGTIEAGGPTAAATLALFFVYLATTAMADAALLHLALEYPRGRAIDRKTRLGLYSPAGLALLLALLVSVSPGTLLPRTLLEAFAGLVLLIANLFSLSAGFLFLTRPFAVEPAVRRAGRLSWIALSMLVGSVLALLGAGGVLPGHPEAWNLALAVIPISLAFALISETLSAPSAPQESGSSVDSSDSSSESSDSADGEPRGSSASMAR